MKKSKKRRNNRPSPLLALGRWSCFNYEATSIADRRWLDSAGNNFVSISLPGPCNHDQIVRAVCEKASLPISIQRLSTELMSREYARGRGAFGSVWDEFDSIARNYPNMQWWISDRRLIMDIVDPPKPRREFYEVAGKLILEMRQQSPNSPRLSRNQWLEITSHLEEFRILELLPKKRRQELGEWNQRNGTRAVRTLSEAIKAQQPRWVHREAMRVLYRSSEKFHAKSGAKALINHPAYIYA